MAHLSELADYNLTLTRNRLTCGHCQGTWKANPKKAWDADPMVLPCGWEKCPNDCHGKALRKKRGERAGKPGKVGRYYVQPTVEESLARQARLAATRDIWDRYVSAHEAGKTELEDKLYARYVATGGMALPLQERPKPPWKPNVADVLAMWEPS